MVGNNNWPVNHESCHLAIHCPRGNILPWHCILKTKWRPQHFGQSLATASFCPGRHLDPGSVNWRSRAVCAFFSLLHWIRIILGMWNVGWSKCFKSNRHCFMASNVTNVETESGPKIWEANFIYICCKFERFLMSKVFNCVIKASCCPSLTCTLSKLTSFELLDNLTIQHLIFPNSIMAWLNASRLGQFCETLKIRVKLILNCPRAHAITYTNSTQLSSITIIIEVIIYEEIFWQLSFWA